MARRKVSVSNLKGKRTKVGITGVGIVVYPFAWERRQESVLQTASQIILSAVNTVLQYMEITFLGNIRVCVVFDCFLLLCIRYCIVGLPDWTYKIEA